MWGLTCNTSRHSVVNSTYHLHGFAQVFLPQRKTRSNNTEPRQNVKLHTTEKPKQNNSVFVGANPIRLWFKGGEDTYFSLRNRPALQSLGISACSQLSTLQDSSYITVSPWLDKKQAAPWHRRGQLSKIIAKLGIILSLLTSKICYGSGKNASGLISKKERKEDKKLHAGT